MASLKDLVAAVKAKIKNEMNDSIELFDISNNSVIFHVATVYDIEPGIYAEPDGEFVFSNGQKVIIKDGKIEEISDVTPEEETETEIEFTPEEEAEVKNEAEEVVEEVEEDIKEEEKAPEEDEKDKVIKELQDKVSELTQLLEEATVQAQTKEAEIAEITNDLNEIKNFYSKVNKNIERQEVKQVEKVSGFSFSRKK